MRLALAVGVHGKALAFLRTVMARGIVLARKRYGPSNLILNNYGNKNENYLCFGDQIRGSGAGSWEYQRNGLFAANISSYDSRIVSEGLVEWVHEQKGSRWTLCCWHAPVSVTVCVV